MLEIYHKALDVNDITQRWYKLYQNSNFGAMMYFIGVVRDEKNIQGLSFEISEAILNNWFHNWQDMAKQEYDNENIQLLMAHTKGDVPVHKCSYICAVFSTHRKLSLAIISEFVEDFKKNAPIWKYELRYDKRIYSAMQSQSIDGSGLLV